MTTNTRRALLLAMAILAGCDRDDIEHDDQSEVEQTFAQRVAEAYCAALFACDPAATCVVGDPIYPSEAACLDAERTALEEAQAAAQGAGLTFDAACVEATIARYAAQGCHTQGYLEVWDPAALDTCPAYHGTIPEGEDPCTDVVGSNFGDCGRGLLCDFDDVCYSPNDETCRCDEGTACNKGGSDPYTCIPVLATGDACLDMNGHASGVCEPDARCEAEFDEADVFVGATCAANVPLGGQCEVASECGGPCENNVCVPPSPNLCEEWVRPSRWR